MRYYNIHTHDPTAEPDVCAIINQYPDEFSPNGIYSVGIHPWRIDAEKTEDWLSFIERCVVDPNCIAIGECGLDKRIETPISEQVAVFKEHLLLAQKYSKPLIIHCVSAYDEIIKLKKEFDISVPMVIHGFSKSAQLANQLVSAGFYLSFGKHLLRNPDLSLVLKDVPDNRIFLETDSSNESIAKVYTVAARAKQIPEEALAKFVSENFNTVFGLK